MQYFFLKIDQGKYFKFFEDFFRIRFGGDMLKINPMNFNFMHLTPKPQFHVMIMNIDEMIFYFSIGHRIRIAMMGNWLVWTGVKTL